MPRNAPCVVKPQRRRRTASIARTSVAIPRTPAPRTEAVAAELLIGDLRVENGKSKLLATRKEVERGWRATSGHSRRPRPSRACRPYPSLFSLKCPHSGQNENRSLKKCRSAFSIPECEMSISCDEELSMDDTTLNPYFGAGLSADRASTLRSMSRSSICRSNSFAKASIFEHSSMISPAVTATGIRFLS